MCVVVQRCRISVDLHRGTANCWCQRSSVPQDAMTNARQVGLRGRQQLAGFLTSSVAARSALRTVFVNALQLTDNNAEQLSKILHQTTPDLRRNPKTIEQQRSKLLRCRSSLVRSCLVSRPIQKTQVPRC
jgi:hypothetical protein